MTDFITRNLTVIIGIGAGPQGDKQGPFYTLENHRVSADIKEWGGEAKGDATVRIYGMSQDLMNQLTTMDLLPNQLRSKNTIQVLAAVGQTPMTTVYKGNIQIAFIDFNNAPDVFFEVQALSGTDAAMTPAQATSTPYNVPTSVDSLMRNWANILGIGYINAGVDITVMNVTYNGSIYDQINACKNAFGFDAFIDTRNTLRIKPHLGAFTDEIPVISPTTGMVGYPLFSSKTIVVKSLFIPAAVWGGKVQIKDSQIVAANAFWNIWTAHHELESLMPNGKWFTTLSLYRSTQ